ncbi:MAG: Thiolase [Gammaproteobacteria bacterium]|jgi:acetyl-CoA acetyltransferase|nr:Thiolase [Gammaproteobacteria bacterium]
MTEAVYILGTSCTLFQKRPDRTLKDLTREAYLGVLADAGLATGADISAAWFGNCFAYYWQQACIRGNVCFIPLVREGLFPERAPVINVESGCATASVALAAAYKEVKAGDADLTLAIGVEKMFDRENPTAVFPLFAAGIDQLDPQEWQAHYREVAQSLGLKFDPDPHGSIAMDTYAIQALEHMHRYGTTREQIAAGAAKNHCNGALNPLAQYRFEMSVEAVLADRLVADPLTRSMCAPIGDGAAAALVCSEKYLFRQPEAIRARAVRICGLALTGGKYRRLDEPGLTREAAKRAYSMAGVVAGDIDVAEIHDATSFSEIYQSEMLGFCGAGEGGPFVAGGATALHGSLPINTSGGLVSKGHPIGATGLSMCYELATQLRGEAGARQVEGARFALQENGGGIIGLEEALAAVIIYEGNA